VALARALAARPALLLADEPTGNLDQETGDVVMALLFRLCAEAGAALLLITHDPALTARCARVVRLADGRLGAGAEPGTPAPNGPRPAPRHDRMDAAARRPR